VRIDYYPDTDSLYIKLKPSVESEGVEVAPGIVFHYTPQGEVTAIDIDSGASALADVSSLEAAGLPLKGEAAEQVRDAERERFQAYLERMDQTFQQLHDSTVHYMRGERSYEQREQVERE
jgi:uncharacterized protein YuzE